jgi:hypothetical protein
MIEGGATMQSSCQAVILPGPKKSWGPTVDDRALLSNDKNGQQEILEDESPEQGVEGWQLLEGVDVSAPMISRTVHSQESSLNPSLF